MQWKSFKFYGAAILLCVTVYISPFGISGTSEASTVNDLRGKIEERADTIKQLDAEINKYREELNKTNQEARTLQSAVRTLDLTQSKLNTDLRVTSTRIEHTDLTIQKLETEIERKERLIDQHKEVIAQAIRMLDSLESESTIEILLKYDNISSFWNQIAYLAQFKSDVHTKIKELQGLKVGLVNDIKDSEQEKYKLLGYIEELDDKKKIVEQNKQEKTQLLTQTQNKESEYKQLLADRVAKKEAFEREMRELESQLRIQIDPSSLPQAGTRALLWPLDDVHITQQFGDTEFARTGAYNGKGHNGIDFRAAQGTRIKAAASGVVEGVGDTDLVRGCYSYGKWILVRHSNGLSTLYAHLSLIKVSPGQSVGAGEVIGYSGNTGYSTGPHLHFGVYASQGVKIIKYETSINCKNAVIPIADLKAYLNPILYLK